MSSHELIRGLDSPEAAKTLQCLYGDLPGAKKRVKALVKALTEGFPEAAGTARLFSAPGRTELGGNHTDHNRGRVLAASIQLDILAAVSPREDKQVLFRSAGFGDIRVDLSGLDARPKERGSPQALVRGVAAGFAKRGIAVGGFTGCAESRVLPGSGLSSSAAVEMLLGRIFDALYGGGSLGALDLARIGQEAENNYFGKPSGLMDQAACALGGAAAIDFEKPSGPGVTRLPFDPEAAGYALCVVNTGESHANLTPDYGAIPAEMGAVAAFFGKKVLREVKPRAIHTHFRELREKLGDRAVLRALHFFDENHRVVLMTQALEALNAAKGSGAKQRAMHAFLSLVNQSGDASFKLLQNIYTPQNPRTQGLGLALALTGDFLQGKPRLPGLPGAPDGACRVHGGGFAGTIQAYIPLEHLAPYRALMEKVFGRGALTRLTIRPLGAAELLAPLS
jgi:galactokinase